MDRTVESRFPAAEASERHSGKRCAWARLLLGIVLLWLVMFVIGPLPLRLPWYGAMGRFIESEGIRSTAIYYTDLEIFRSAEFDLRHRLQYRPEASDATHP